MPRIGLFACDIYETFSFAKAGLKNEEYERTRDGLLKYFVFKLKEIIETNNLDELIISFYCAFPEKERLFKYVSLLKPYLERSNINLGSQYMETKCYDQDCNFLYAYKANLNIIEEIKKAIEILQVTGEVVWLGIADNDLSEENFEKLIKNKTLAEISKICGFRPSEGSLPAMTDNISHASKKGLEGLVESLVTYNNSVQKKEVDAILIESSKEEIKRFLKTVASIK